MVRTSVEDDIERLLLSSESGAALMISFEDKERQMRAIDIQKAYRNSNIWQNGKATRKIAKEKREQKERNVISTEIRNEKNLRNIRNIRNTRDLSIQEEENDPDRTSMDPESMLSPSGSFETHSRTSSSRNISRSSSHRNRSPENEIFHQEFENQQPHHQPPHSYQPGVFSRELRRYDSAESFEDYFDAAFIEDENNFNNNQAWVGSNQRPNSTYKSDAGAM